MRASVEKRLEAAALRVDALVLRADAEQAPDWLRAALAAASVKGLMRLERMLADWPHDVLIPPAALLAALDLPSERRP
jgi:hypothetical protein